MNATLSLADSPPRIAPSWTAQGALSGGLWVLTLLTINPLDREEAINDVASLDPLALAKVIARLGALACFSYLLLAHWNDQDRRKSMWLLAPLALYWCWGMVTIAWSPLRTVSLGQLMSLLMLCELSTMVVLVDRGEPTSRKLLFHLSCVLLAFSSLMLGMAIVSGGVDERFGFYLAHPTAVGGTASLGIVVLLASNLLWKWSWARALLLPGLAIHMVVLLLAHNRSALLSMLPVAALLILAYGDRRLLTLAGLVGSLLVIIVAMVDPSWQWLLRSAATGGEFISREQSWDQLAAFSGREELWTIIWSSFLESPWLGHGYFVSTDDGLIAAWGREENFNAHNMLLQALSSTGLVGTAIFLWSLGRPLLFACRNLRSRPEVAKRSSLFVLICAWLLIWGQFDVAILGPITPFAIVFFVALGLLAGACLDRPGPHSEIQHA